MSNEKNKFSTTFVNSDAINRPTLGSNGFCEGGGDDWGVTSNAAPKFGPGLGGGGKGVLSHGAGGGGAAIQPTTQFLGGGGFIPQQWTTTPNINYKYAEDRILVDLKAHLDKTYTEHYKTDETEVECFDAWIALGDSTPTFRNTAIKYLWRYGKKGGSNKKDLLKAMHYVLMCLYVDHYKDKK